MITVKCPPLANLEINSPENAKNITAVANVLYKLLRNGRKIVGTSEHVKGGKLYQFIEIGYKDKREMN